jgi:hypothetical protein
MVTYPPCTLVGTSCKDCEDLLTRMVVRCWRGSLHSIAANGEGKDNPGTQQAPLAEADEHEQTRFICQHGMTVLLTNASRAPTNSYAGTKCSDLLDAIKPVMARHAKYCLSYVAVSTSTSPSALGVGAGASRQTRRVDRCTG